VPLLPLNTAAWYVTRDGNLPTVEEMKKIYQLPSPDDPTYERKADLAVWYYTSYLPSASDGEANFGGQIPFHFLPTSRMFLNGKERIRVESASEAFGLLVFENCREKWKIDCQVMKETGKKPVYLKKDPSTLKWKDLDKKTVWTKATGGRGHGWDPKAVGVFNAYSNSIKKFREEDAKTQYQTLRRIQDLAKTKHNITGGPTNALQSKARVPEMKEVVEEQPKEEPASLLAVELNCESDDDYGAGTGRGIL